MDTPVNKLDSDGMFVRPMAHLQLQNQNNVVFIVSKDGRIIKDEIDVTDNDSALAGLLIELLKTVHNTQVNRSK